MKKKIFKLPWIEKFVDCHTCDTPNSIKKYYCPVCVREIDGKKYRAQAIILPDGKRRACIQNPLEHFEELNK